MISEFIPYEQAKQLKQLGFDELCFASYETETNWHLTNRPWRNSEDLTEIASPLYQQAFLWFREKYNIFTGQYIDQKDNFNLQIKYINKKNQDEIIIIPFAINEIDKATLVCMDKLIEIVKNK